MFRRIVAVLALLNSNGYAHSQASLSFGELPRTIVGSGSLKRRGEADQPLGWENGWGVAPGERQEVPNLIREGSAQEDMDIEEVLLTGSGDGTVVDDEDLLGHVETTGGAEDPQSSTNMTVEGGKTREDWSKEYEYDSDNYIDLDDDINDEAVEAPLPKLVTEGQNILANEGSEIVLPCQVGKRFQPGNFISQVDLLGDLKITWRRAEKFLAVGDSVMDARVTKSGKYQTGFCDLLFLTVQ